MVAEILDAHHDQNHQMWMIDLDSPHIEEFETTFYDCKKHCGE